MVFENVERITNSVFKALEEDKDQNKAVNVRSCGRSISFKKRDVFEPESLDLNTYGNSLKQSGYAMLDDLGLFHIEDESIVVVFSSECITESMISSIVMTANSLFEALTSGRLENAI